jgi:hypothetical protein
MGIHHGIALSRSRQDKDNRHQNANSNAHGHAFVHQLIFICVSRLALMLILK